MRGSDEGGMRVRGGEGRRPPDALCRHVSLWWAVSQTGPTSRWGAYQEEVTVYLFTVNGQLMTG